MLSWQEAVLDTKRAVDSYCDDLMDDAIRQDPELANDFKLKRLHMLMGAAFALAMAYNLSERFFKQELGVFKLEREIVSEMMRRRGE